MIYGLYKNVTNNLFTNHIFNIYKQDLALNNLEGLICHKTQLTNPLQHHLYIQFGNI